MNKHRKMNKYRLPIIPSLNPETEELYLWVTTSIKDYENFTNQFDETCQFISDGEIIYGETYIFVTNKETKEKGALVYINIDEVMKATLFTLVTVSAHEAVHVANSYYRRWDMQPELTKDENYAMVVGWAAEHIYESMLYI